MTAIDDAISSITQVQQDFGKAIDLLRAYQNGNYNGVPIDTTTLKTTIQALATKITTDLQTAQTKFQAAVATL